MNTYDIGDVVRCAAVFKVGGTDTDPDDVIFKILEPDGSVTTYEYGVDAEVVKSSTGSFRVDWPIVKSDIHWYRFAGTGAAQAAGEDFFNVRDSMFP